MAEYIEREKTLAVFCDWCGVCPEEKREPLKCDDILAGVLKKLPAADVRPVVRGAWKETIFGWECPVCGEEQQYARRLRFCPNCGADMRGGGIHE